MDPWAEAAPWTPHTVVDPWADPRSDWKEPESSLAPEVTPPEEQRHVSSATDDLQPVMVDDEDPWGSGAAARQLEVEATARRMEILRLQAEAKGKEIDEHGYEVEAVQETEASAEEGEEKASETQEVEWKAGETQGLPEAPVTTGWRALFNRGTAKPATSEDGTAPEETPKIDNAVVAKESPRASTATGAPRLWQAPTILGSHARSTSSSSRADANKEPPAKSTTPPAVNKGPGWEVTTKKQSNAGGGGGLIQSLFGSSNTTNADEKVTITTTRKETKTSGLNRFGRGMQPPPVVSAADEEDDSFETDPTGIEWEAGNIFDGKDKQLDLLFDDVDAKPTSSTVGKLLGRWRGKEASKADSDDLSKIDLAWLESVGAGSSEIVPGSSKGPSTTETDTDWMSFINRQNSTASTLSAAASTSDRLRISSTSRASVSTKIPPLAPPPPPSTHRPASGGQRVTSPFSFRGPDPASSLSNSRLASAVSARTRSTQDVFGDFEHASMDESPNPNGYRDDVTENDASLLRDRPGQTRKDSGFLRSLQGKGRGNRYEYDEDDLDSHDDGWTAFRDQDPSTDSTLRNNKPSERHHAASPPLVPSASVARSKSGSSAMQGTKKPTNALIPPPPSIPSQNWNRSGPLLPPPGRPHSTDQVKQSAQVQPAAFPPNKPKTLSQGKTLTNDDLSFFESL